MKMSPPDTRYKMLYAGAWRPVTNMYAYGSVETDDPMKCSAAVLYVADDKWIAIKVTPGDIIRRDGRTVNQRDWDVIC